jgi:two-component system OmpR family response regulator
MREVSSHEATLASDADLHVLVVEDDRMLARHIRTGLEALGGFRVAVASSSCDGFQASLANGLDCIVADLGLPDGSGIDLITRWRGHGIDVPVVVLTARGDAETTIAALGAGADDYLVKPVAIEVLEAHVRALVRRWRKPRWPIRRHGDLVLRPDTLTVHRGATEITLTPTQARLLEVLIENAGLVLTRTQIAAHIGHGLDESISNVVDVHVRALRTKIDEPFGTETIETVRGVGYRIRSA